MAILQVKSTNVLETRQQFFHESIVYPFAKFTINKSNFEISSKDFLDILNYVEHFGLTSLVVTIVRFDIT